MPRSTLLILTAMTLTTALSACGTAHDARPAGSTSNHTYSMVADASHCAPQAAEQSRFQLTAATVASPPLAEIVVEGRRLADSPLAEIVVEARHLSAVTLAEVEVRADRLPPAATAEDQDAGSRVAALLD
jgi:hypothetical protein